MLVGCEMLGNHLLGIYEKAFDPDDSWEQRLKNAKKLGFDYVELSIDEKDMRLERLDWTQDQIKEMKLLCQNIGIGFQSMCLSAHRRFPFGSADPAIRLRAHEIMEKAVDLANALGIRVIQLAGYDVYYEDSTPESVKLFREGMQWSAKIAARKQVMLGMEIMDTPFLNSISKHMAYESMIESPWYKVYPDMGNISAWPENDVEFEFKHGVGSIVGVHLKDTLAVTDSFKGKFKCVPFGTGCVDFPRRFQQLEELDYTGPYTIEMWYQEGQDQLETIANAKAWLEEQYKFGVGRREAHA